MARLPPSRHTLHRRLRFLDRRTRRHPPLRTTFLPAALATCHSRGLPTQRRHRSDPNATSRTRSPRCGGALSPPLPELSRDALVATRRSARRHEFPITDAVRLAVEGLAMSELNISRWNMIAYVSVAQTEVSA